ncbi:MAG: gluzincin family metallopeptidase [Thermoplasmatota archaeon]
MALTLDDLRRELEAFEGEAGAEVYANYAGLKDELAFAPIYARHPMLTSRDTIAAARALGSREFEAFAVEGVVEDAVKELSDELATREAQATVTVGGETAAGRRPGEDQAAAGGRGETAAGRRPGEDQAAAGGRGETIAFRAAQLRVAGEDDRAKRAAWQHARDAVIAGTNPLRAKRLATLHALAKDLGYVDYVDMIERTRRLGLDALAKMLDALIVETDALYAREMGARVEAQCGVPLAEAEKHDSAYLLRAKPFDAAFPKAGALPLLRSTLGSLGFDLGAQKNIALDTEERPKKSPRAFVVTPRVPDDVRLVVFPQGGLDDYRTLFHEAGHAEHYANVDAALPAEHRYLGDASVTESYAFLFEKLFAEPEFARPLAPPAGYFAHLALVELYFIRRYAAKLRYELALHRGAADAPSLYKRTLESVMHFQHPEAHYLSDVDDAFYAAQYLRAWLFEAMLRERLARDFGSAWWTDRAAGGFLRSLYARGQREDVVELADELGLGALTTRPLLASIERGFRE